MGNELEIAAKAGKILAELEKKDCSRTIVVAIDGRCASGKSTVAEYLAKTTGAGVVHMDDFFLPLEIRTAERFSTPGGNVHYERFAEEVIPNLRSGCAFEYGTFICGDAMRIEGVREVKASGLIVVEGAYSHHPFFKDYADLYVFSDISYESQLERIYLRNGAERLEMFKKRWIPLEEEYLKYYDIKGRADLII